MKTVDEILDLADSYAENPCQAICDALYKNEDEARDKILELELRLCEATERLDRVMKICQKHIRLIETRT
jgi:hypothetical protein|tara:strand:- start:235 stop:444 length:210 start_codon:yes stop_codon:yes gene_type:complete